MMYESSSTSSVRLKEVYDMASEIASEFEKIVNVCGSENLRPVVLKVISCLEYLESTVIKLEDTERELDEIKIDFNQLASKKALYQEEKFKLVQELEQMEENWAYEVQQLKSLIKKLQEDKDSLQNSLEISSTSSERVTEEELSDESLLENLQSTVTILSSRLEEKDKTLKKIVLDHEAVKNRVEYLSELNKVLRLRCDKAKTEVRQLWKDRTDLEFQVESYEMSVKSLQDCLNESSKQTMDLEQECSSIYDLSHDSSEEDLCIAGDAKDKIKYLIQMQETLQERISHLEQELFLLKQKNQNRQRFVSSSFDSVDIMYHHSHTSLHGFYGIRHMFQLFLGMLSVQPCNFRPSLNQ